MSVLEVRVPDLGEAEKVQVVELLVSIGDRVAKDDGLITLESDKASMDIPSPADGVVGEIRVENGSEVKEGDLVLTLELSAEQQTRHPDAAASAAEPVEEEAARGQRASPSAAAAEAAAPRPAATSTGVAAAGSDLRAEILVLGAGPGGYTAAFRAADLGKDVALVERYPALGGVCLNVGCIPSKALLHVTRVIEEARDLGDRGIDFGKPKLDLDKLRAWKDSVVQRLTKGLDAMADKRRVRVIRGTGRFASANSLTVDAADGPVEVSFNAAIVAAGSRVIKIGGVPWDDPRLMDSTAALELEEVPKRLLLVGGGIVGLEMAMVYGALGSRLTVVEMLDGLVPGCDRDLVKPLERRLKRRYGATIHLQTRVAEVKPLKRGLKVLFEGGGQLAPEVFDRVLVAVGRRPNGDRIGAEAAGIEVDDHGYIPVDRQQRTNVSHIFAIGDITGQPMLAHKATHQGKVAAEVAAGGKSGFDARVVPSVAYTDPEIAWVGLTETEAQAQGTAYEKSSFPWSASGRALGMGRGDGLTKLLFDPDTRRLLGAGVVGPAAGDLIAELALAIEMDCEAADLALTVHPHPTLSETVALAAEVFEGTVTDLYLPKR